VNTVASLNPSIVFTPNPTLTPAPTPSTSGDPRKAQARCPFPPFCSTRLARRRTGEMTCRTELPAGQFPLEYKGRCSRWYLGSLGYCSSCNRNRVEMRSRTRRLPYAVALDACRCVPPCYAGANPAPRAGTPTARGSWPGLPASRASLPLRDGLHSASVTSGDRSLRSPSNAGSEGNFRAGGSAPTAGHVFPLDAPLMEVPPPPFVGEGGGETNDLESTEGAAAVAQRQRTT